MMSLVSLMVGVESTDLSVDDARDANVSDVSWHVTTREDDSNGASDDKTNAFVRSCRH